jgi:hypothetical protein
MPFIGTDDGYWYSLQEKSRIMEIHHLDQEIGRAFYNPHDPMKTFNRVINRHRNRCHHRQQHQEADQSPEREM